MAALRPSTPVLLSNVTFDDTNFWEWSRMLHVCLDSERLWDHLTSHPARPPVPVCSGEPTIGADGALPSDDAHAAYTIASE
jgi:hypothetical protein